MQNQFDGFENSSVDLTDLPLKHNRRSKKSGGGLGFLFWIALGLAVIVGAGHFAERSAIQQQTQQQQR